MMKMVRINVMIQPLSTTLFFWLIVYTWFSIATATLTSVSSASNISYPNQQRPHHLRKTDESDVWSPDTNEGFETFDENIISDIFPSELYHSQQEPFRSFPCYPKYIHLAQAGNVMQNENDATTPPWMINMTISFALDFTSCACAVPSVVYGGPVDTSRHISDHRVLSHHSKNHIRSATSSERVAKLPIHMNPLQFNYTSDKTNGQTYQSDWIYHIPVTQLLGGLRTYWYRIVVTERDDCPTYTKQWNVHFPNIPQPPPQQQQQRRSLRGSDGYYIGETKIYTFVTPPIPGQATSLALVGDLGQTMNSAQTIYQIYSKTATAAVNKRINSGIQRNIDAKSHIAMDGGEYDNIPPISQLLIAGDLSYADSDPGRWTSFLELIEPLVRTLPLHVVAGNHEIECDTTTNQLFVPYEHWFQVPNRIQSAISEPITDEYKQTLWDRSCSAPSVFQGVYDYGNSFYSYQHGLVYIIVLNSYTKSTKGSAQYEWLVSELKKYHQNDNRSTTPWLLVSFHAPIYTTFLGHVNEEQSVEMKDALEPIFIEYGVNIIVSGKCPRGASCVLHIPFPKESILTKHVIKIQVMIMHICGHIQWHTIK